MIRSFQYMQEKKDLTKFNTDNKNSEKTMNRRELSHPNRSINRKLAANMIQYSTGLDAHSPEISNRTRISILTLPFSVILCYTTVPGQINKEWGAGKGIAIGYKEIKFFYSQMTCLFKYKTLRNQQKKKIYQN